MRWHPADADVAPISRFEALFRRLFGRTPGPIGPVTLGESADEDEHEHLHEVPDGAGCTEIWEHLSDRREQADDD